MKVSALLGTALVILALAPAARAARAADFPKGLGQDAEKEKPLAESVERAAKLMEAGKVDFAAVVAEIQIARKLFAEAIGEAMKAEAPELSAVELPEKSPVISYGEAASGDVLARWGEQLVYYVGSARGIMDGDRKYLLEWTGRPGFQKPERRVSSMAATLREAERVATLLSRPAEDGKVAKGEELFADDFAEGAGNWELYGQCVTKNEGNAFRLKDEKSKHPDAMMWTKKEFEGDFLAEFNFIPHTEGTNAGALFTICGRAKREKDGLGVCVGSTMQTYNYGINGYHFSMHRGETGLGNARRVGPGLKLLMSGKDPCPTPGQEYRVSIGKVGPAIFLMVDGKLSHHWYDGATYGPVLDAGHIGLRHWAGLDASYKDFHVYRLEPAK